MSAKRLERRLIRFWVSKVATTKTKTAKKAEIEIDFDTRLKLETAVGNLNDEEILNQWQKFVDSKIEAEAQEEVKNLLEMLVNKVKVQ